MSEDFIEQQAALATWNNSIEQIDVALASVSDQLDSKAQGAEREALSTARRILYRARQMQAAQEIVAEALATNVR